MTSCECTHAELDLFDHDDDNGTTTQPGDTTCSRDPAEGYYITCMCRDVRKPRAANHLLFLFIYDTLLTPSKY